jgi:RimJ/RimL family protein N-acetyltransferase
MSACGIPKAGPNRKSAGPFLRAPKGRGVAQETALAARDYAYDTLGWTTAISLIAADNTRSRALAERLGATRDGGFAHERFGQMQVWRHPGPGGRA